MSKILSSAHAAQTFDPAPCIDPLSAGYDHVVRLSPDPENGMWERIELK